MMCCSAAITRAVHKRGIATATAAASSTPRKAASDTAARKCATPARRFARKIREAIGGRTEELERLGDRAVRARLSVRDIEAAFVDDNGKSLLSKTAVSEIAERLWADYQTFAARGLAEYRVLYLFVDGIAEWLHLGQKREAVLAAWDITDTGNKVLLGLTPGRSAIAFANPFTSFQPNSGSIGTTTCTSLAPVVSTNACSLSSDKGVLGTSAACTT
jgi:hypothetical protein